MKEVVIVGALRTPIGCFQGTLARHSAVELGSMVVKALIERTGVDANAIDEVILGQVLTAGAGQNPARQSAIKGGLPTTVSAITINDVCGSGLKALHLATQAIQCGEADIVIAGGQENMSRAPHVLNDSRSGALPDADNLVDSLVHDGLWDAFNDYHIGVTAETWRGNMASAASYRMLMRSVRSKKPGPRLIPDVLKMRLSPSSRNVMGRPQLSIRMNNRGPTPVRRG